MVEVMGSEGSLGVIIIGGDGWFVNEFLMGVMNERGMIQLS